MKRLLVVSLVLVCGCNGKVTQEEQGKLGRYSHSNAPVIIEARIIELNVGCDKYCYYNIELIKVIKNSIKAKLDSRIKAAKYSWESQPEINKTYTLELEYYNDNPADGFKIISFKEK